MSIRVGISGWTYAPWRGPFYPKGLPQKRELEYVAQRMNSVEINGSFYALQKKGSYTSWAASVPEDFVFAVKGGSFITHLKKLNDVFVPLANFFASGVLALDERLGPVLWQLPPHLTFDPVRVRSFLSLLPQTMAEAAMLAGRHDARVKEADAFIVPAHPQQRIRHVVEVRHESFCSQEFFGLLRDHGVGLVLADNPGHWPILEEFTSDLMYVRLHGHAELYASGYTEAELDQWAGRVRGWVDRGLDVHVYCDNDAKVRAPYDAMGLMRRLGLEAPGTP